MPKGEYTRTEAGRRVYFVVTGVELPDTLTHDEIKAHSHVLPQDLWRRYVLHPKSWTLLGCFL